MSEIVAAPREEVRTLFVEWLALGVSNIWEHSGSIDRDKDKLRARATARAGRLGLTWDDDMEEALRT